MYTIDNNIETFIFIHNQDIILDFIKNEKFKNINDLKFVFLGQGNIDKIKDLTNLIVCRDLEYNIEEYPFLTSFSGWYALWKNKLYSKKYLNLFEYDIHLSNDFTEKISSLNDETNIIGYIPFNVHHGDFINVDMWSLLLLNSINKNYNINVKDYISNNLNRNYSCSMTSNHTFKNDVFEKYMIWILPMIDDFKKDKYSGHMAERSISLFYILNKINNVKIIDDVLKHYQFNSHGNQSISQDYFNKNYNLLING